MSNILLYCTPVNSNDTIENFEGNCPTNPNPTALSYNTGGPIWCQWFVNHSMVPTSIRIGETYTIPGNPTFTITPYSNGVTVVNNRYISIDEYVSIRPYQLGMVINVGGINYMNVTWNETIGPITQNNRGWAYSGSYGVTPAQDTNAWMQVTITGPTTPPPTTPPPTTPPVTTPPVTTPPVTTRGLLAGATNGASGSPNKAADEWIPGVNNTYVMIGAGAIVLLIVLMK
jgi:hypothetical protein